MRGPREIFVGGAILVGLIANDIGLRISRYSTRVMERDGISVSRLEKQANFFHDGIKEKGRYDYDNDGKKEDYVLCNDGAIFSRLTSKKTENYNTRYFRVD